MVRTGRSLLALACWAGCLHLAAAGWAAPCDPGEFLDEETQTCADCPVGTFSPQAGAVGCCIECGAGSFQTGTGKSFCDLCVAGKYWPDYSTGSDQDICVECTAGKFLALEGVGPAPAPGLSGEAYVPYRKIDPPHGVVCDDNGDILAESCTKCPISMCDNDCETQAVESNRTDFATNSTYTMLEYSCVPVSWIPPMVSGRMRGCAMRAHPARAFPV